MWTRKLRAKGIGVYFEEQAIDSLKAENEMLIGLFSVIAQSESENISANVKWGVQQRMRSGTYMTNFNCYGYRKGDDGIPVIVEEEALIIKKIYQLFIDGHSMKQISDILISEEVKTYSGKLQWEPEHIQRILTNEKYIAVYTDIILRHADTVGKFGLGHSLLRKNLIQTLCQCHSRFLRSSIGSSERYRQEALCGT